jgi:hypothetical protein
MTYAEIRPDETHSSAVHGRQSCDRNRALMAAIPLAPAGNEKTDMAKYGSTRTDVRLGAAAIALSAPRQLASASIISPLRKDRT